MRLRHNSRSWGVTETTTTPFGDDDDDAETELDRQLAAQAQATIARANAMRAEAASRPRAELLDLEEMLARFAYMRNEDRIVDLERPWLAYSRQGFKSLTAASTRTM